MSGVPGKSFICMRNRYPSLCRVRRTFNSGFVFCDLIACMIRRCPAADLMDLGINLGLGFGHLAALRNNRFDAFQHLKDCAAKPLAH